MINRFLGRRRFVAVQRPAPYISAGSQVQAEIEHREPAPRESDPQPKPASASVEERTPVAPEPLEPIAQLPATVEALAQPTAKGVHLDLGSYKPKRGRKPARESRAAEIRAKLTAWKQTPEAYRVSLRALAAQIGTSHQLLSSYLRGLDKWQKKEYQRLSQEILARAKAENRLLTSVEQAQLVDYGRAGFALMIDGAMGKMLGEIRERAMRGKLTGQQLSVLKLLASRGYGNAQEILEAAASR